MIAEFCRTCELEGFDWREMAETVYEHYCRIVYETYLGAKLEDPDAVLLIEARLRLDEFIPEGFGSSDAVIIYNDTLEVFDLKYGKGVKVDFHEDGTISIDLHIMVGNGVNLNAVGNSIIDEVRYMVQNCTGTEVRAVNVYIDSMMID